MKTNFPENILILLSAAYFLFAGLGVNFVNYCCQTFANEWIESVAQHSCSTLHHYTKSIENHENENDIICENTNHHPIGCHLIRLKVDTPSILSISSLIINTFFLTYLFSIYDNKYVSSSVKTQLNYHQPPDNLVHHSERDIITLQAVLLIWNLWILQTDNLNCLWIMFT